jgi:sulfoxide reductase heme-binding subunit YedZ
MRFLKTRTGAWSAVKLLAFAAALAPALWLAGLALVGDLGARPVKAAIVFSGDWAIRLLFVTLAVTPARRIFAAPRLVLARRTLGLAAFGTVILHVGLYAIDQGLDLSRIAAEIVLRVYLAVGAVALAGLLALATTSSDGAVRRLGSARWNRLHRLVYASALLSVVHFLLQAETDAWEPMLMAGLLVWLAGYRLLHRRGEVGARRLIGLAVVAAAFTALAETTWYAIATGVDPWLILRAHLTVAFGLRPAWWVLIAGLAAAAITAITDRFQIAKARVSASSAVSGVARGQSPS